MIPQYIVIGISLLGLLGQAHAHGKIRQRHNFWAHCIAVVITYTLLIWGGFFNGIL